MCLIQCVISRAHRQTQNLLLEMIHLSLATKTQHFRSLWHPYIRVHTLQHGFGRSEENYY